MITNTVTRLFALSQQKAVAELPAVVLTVVALCFFGSAHSARAAGTEGALWKVSSPDQIGRRGQRMTAPDRSMVYKLDRERLGRIFAGTPMEFSEEANYRENMIELPRPDGRMERFRLLESPVLSAELAAQYPTWKTFQAYGVDDPTASARLGITLNGFHATVLSVNGTYRIDPFQLKDRDHYVTYFMRDATRSGEFHCLFDEHLAESEGGAISATAPEFAHGTQIRNFRIAVAATGEYTVLFGGQTAALAKIVTSVNRLSGIYRREFAVSFQLVSGTTLVFPAAATDPYTNLVASDQQNANQVTIDSILGSANYDVGHLIVTTGGGVATLNSLCSTGTKARGISGQPNPSGDPFDVDYLAHEVGHQLGADHTFNAAADCGSVSAAGRMEPGSGVTIMGYTGTCSSIANLQRNSIDNFIGHSQQEIIAFLGGVGGGCGTLSGTNQVPTVSAGSASYSVPFNTPFALTASAADGDGNALTYSWEQNTPGGSSSDYPGTTDDDDTNLANNRPLFRPYSPVTSPTRLFPSLTYILNNANEPPLSYTGTSATGSVCAATCITGEDLPSVARTINFRVTVRDGMGGVADASTNVAFVNTTTPFSITSQNSGTTWNGSSIQTITWNVSSTTAAPISTANVKISLSTDGGQTFPTTLLASTANDGIETIAVPNLSTTQGRVKVEAVGNIFFDINNANLTIVSGPGRTAFDYDGDGKTDISVFRPSLGDWYLQRSTDGLFGVRFGISTDKIAPADYDGDGKTDVAVYRPSSGQWFIANSATGTVTYHIFGLAEDLPTPADYDGDGKADICVFRLSTGTWYRRNSSDGSFFGILFGSAGDRPTVGDFDGDGKADIAIWRPSNGDWYHIRSSNGTIFGERFGISTDKMVPADYDGDGRMDLAVWRPSNGFWYIKKSASSTYTSFPFGVASDIPAPGDFDGDGKTDLSVFRPSEGNWYRQNSFSGTYFAFLFGASGDRPTPTAYLE